MEGNLRLKIDWASLIVGSKFTGFALFYYVFEGNFPIPGAHGAHIWRGDLTEGFLRYRFVGLIRDLKIEVFRHFPRTANVKKSRD